MGPLLVVYLPSQGPAGTQRPAAGTPGAPPATCLPSRSEPALASAVVPAVPTGRCPDARWLCRWLLLRLRRLVAGGEAGDGGLKGAPRGRLEEHQGRAAGAAPPRPTPLSCLLLWRVRLGLPLASLCLCPGRDRRDGAPQTGDGWRGGRAGAMLCPAVCTFPPGHLQ